MSAVMVDLFSGEEDSEPPGDCSKGKRVMISEIREHEWMRPLLNSDGGRKRRKSRLPIGDRHLPRELSIQIIHSTPQFHDCHPVTLFHANCCSRPVSSLWIPSAPSPTFQILLRRRLVFFCIACINREDHRAAHMMNFTFSTSDRGK